MSFDVATVLVLCTFCSLLSAAVLGVTRAREGVADVREAIFAMLALAAAYILQLLRETLDPSLVVVTSNALFWLAATFIFRTCRRFTSERPQARWPLAVIGLGIALFVVFVTLGVPYGARAFTTSLICVLLCVPSLHELARDGGLRKEPTRRLMFALLLTTTAALALRALILLPHLTQESNLFAPALERTVAFVPSLIFSQGFGLALVVMHLERNANQARDLALTDALTGCLNRRALEMHAEAELAHAIRHQRRCALVIVDLDHFKRVNDTYGHAAGDAALTHTGTLLRDAVRPGDVVARYGGEEFCILLRETTADQAAVVAERLRERIARSKVEIAAGELSMTASLGVADFEPRASESWRDLFHRADEALYRSKQGGRDRVTVAAPSAATSSSKHPLAAT